MSNGIPHATAPVRKPHPTIGIEMMRTNIDCMAAIPRESIAHIGCSTKAIEIGRFNRIGIDPNRLAINSSRLIEHMSKIDYLSLKGNTLRKILTVLEEMSVFLAFQKTPVKGKYSRPYATKTSKNASKKRSSANRYRY